MAKLLFSWFISSVIERKVAGARSGRGTFVGIAWRSQGSQRESALNISRQCAQQTLHYLAIIYILSIYNICIYYLWVYYTLLSAPPDCSQVEIILSHVFVAYLRRLLLGRRASFSCFSFWFWFCFIFLFMFLFIFPAPPKLSTCTHCVTRLSCRVRLLVRSETPLLRPRGYI